MAKKHGDDKELTEFDAQIVKGMLKRKDSQHHIASYFGVDSRAITHIHTGKTFVNVGCALPSELPPPGPYAVDPIYIIFYKTMTRVNQLWDERQLPKAKTLLEKALKNPVFSTELETKDGVFAEVLRDEFGLSKFDN
jgi:hypothetical protein